MAVAIGSYNMSFASDLGAVIGSEKHFLLNGYQEKDPKSRELWNNACTFVHRFFTEVPNAAAVGLQEQNVRAKVQEKNPAFTGGTDAVVERLSADPALKDVLSYYVCTPTVTPSGAPTIMTVWRHDILGKLNSERAYCGDLGKTPGIYDDRKNDGRPISIIQTDKGVTLINLHAPNKPDDSLDGARTFRAALQYHVGACGFGHTINPAKLFVMGDFNDPHNAIKASKPLKIGPTELFHTLTDAKTLSCCYNFNSSCPDDLFNNTDALHTREDGLTASARECYINRSADPAVNEELSGKAKLMGDRGKLSNYKFTGDYVLGANLVTSLQIWRPVPREVSLESDHEMVYATFAMPAAGGYRKKYRKSKKARKNKRRATRRRS